MRKPGFRAASALVLFMAGCASTQVSSVWRDESVSPAQARPQKALVVAVVPDPAVRRNLEDDLARKLQERGVPAVPSHRLVQDVRDLNQNQVQQIARQQGADGVLVTRFRGIQRHLDYQPGYGWDGFWGVWDPWMYQPGYLAEHTSARMETMLFNPPEDGGQLIWTATTQTFNPSGSERQIAGLAGKIVDQMHKDAVI